MLCFTRVLDFSCVFTRDLDPTFKNASENMSENARERKKITQCQKNARKLPNARKAQENCSISHYAWLKTRACCVFLAFLLTFLLTNLTKTQPQHIV